MSYDGPSSALFPNKKKTKENQPDMTGKIELNDVCIASINSQIAQGVQFPQLDVAAWKKISRAGGDFISLSVKEKWERDGDSSSSGNTGNTGNDDIGLDEIPF